MIEEHVEINPFTRPGVVREDTRAVDLHWNGNAGMSEYGLSDYFDSLARQQLGDDEPDRYAGANYVVGPREVIEKVPSNEVTYTDGADGKTRCYTGGAKKLFGEEYTMYWPESKLSPNHLTVSVELVHPDQSGVFNERTVKNTAHLVARLLAEYNLDIDALVRHFDITGKLCPKAWVQDIQSWFDFKGRVGRILDTI